MKPMAWLRGFGCLGLVGLVLGCDAVLGGLEEGTRVASSGLDASLVESRDASVAAPVCEGWLPGARFRRRVHLRSREALRAHPVRLSLDTARLVREGKIQDASRGLVFVSSGGARVPHVFDGPARTDAAPIYAAFDVDPGETSAWVYYGGEAGAEPLGTDDVFVPRVLVDGAFANPGFKSWTPLPLGRGTGYEIRVEAGRARFSMLGAGESESFPVGLCQFATFPPGRRYKLVYDAESESGPRQFRVTRNGLNGEPIGLLSDRLPARSLVAGPIPPGDALVCFVVQRLPIETVVDLSIANVRVAPWADEEPGVVGIDPEEACGAP